jgi:RNA polymerase sigma factor (sigma-70 family)
MKYSKRLETFERVRANYAGFLTSVLWKLTGDKELFAEAMQYAMLKMWQHIEKLNGKKAPAYIYRIALSANSKAWRNRIGRDGQINQAQSNTAKDPSEKTIEDELAKRIRRAISQLPARQCRAIVMRYLEQKDYNSIAEKLNCSAAGARSNVSKALATLKSKFAAPAEGGV